MKLYSIYAMKFQSILAHDLTDEEILIAKSIRQDLSFDEYAGYSPKQQHIYKKLIYYITSIGKILEYEEI